MKGKCKLEIYNYVTHWNLIISIMADNICELNKINKIIKLNIDRNCLEILFRFFLFLSYTLISLQFQDARILTDLVTVVKYKY